ncbi:hypothetical protein CAEBREN_24154 [Caenorhabditis brenneri]|uniref:Uncharacterized protein n=1 Tax=Caenorhabditis brenneri TaxID=135651 RepID=G0MUT5_CAEBE|nr:hypothetical protein CAEBREN_24154 [Caenorhabditis brenneri]
MLNKMNGSVPNQETEEPLPSIFSKLSSSEDVPPPPPNTFKTVASEVSSVSSSPTSPNMIPCICFNCWAPYKLSKTWKSPDEENMKRKSMGKESDNMEQTQSSTTVSSFPPTACSFSPSPTTTTTTTIPASTEQFPTVTLLSTVSRCSLEYCSCAKRNEENMMKKENELLRKKAILQWEVIRKLMEIGHISDELREMAKKN